jgi:hypothetical protein
MKKKESHRRTGCRREDNIKMNPARITNDIERIQLVQDKIHDLTSWRRNLFQGFQEIQQWPVTELPKQQGDPDD